MASALAFNFFQIPPLHRFTIADEENWVALATFVIVAAVSSSVAGLARAQALEAERRREQADRALAELAALSAERDRMQAEMVEAEALRRSDELKTALLRSISHDLRTPLTSIIASGAALGSATLTAEERAELSEAIVAEGERLSRLVENLIDMSRLEAGKAEPHREAIDLAEVLDAARDATDAAARWCGWRSTATCRSSRPTPPSSSAPSPTCSRTRSATAAAGRCWSSRGWSVTRSPCAWSTRVPASPKASGSGSSSRSIAARPTGRRRGTGLGLAIAKGFVEANGGEISVESLPGQGSSFVVSMPCRDASRQ